MNKSIKTYLKRPSKDNTNRSANPSVTRASTILFNSMQELKKHELKIKQNKKITHYSYGRYGSSTTIELENILKVLENAYHVFLTGTGFGGIDIIAGNNHNNLQPMVLGHNLVAVLREHGDVLDKIVGTLSSVIQNLAILDVALSTHFHPQSFPPGAPNIPSPTLAPISITVVSFFICLRIFFMFLFSKVPKRYKLNPTISFKGVCQVTPLRVNWVIWISLKILIIINKYFAMTILIFVINITCRL